MCVSLMPDSVDLCHWFSVSLTVCGIPKAVAVTLRQAFVLSFAICLLTLIFVLQNTTNSLLSKANPVIQ